MQAIVGLVAGLIVVNGLLLLIIAMVLLENPFRMGVLITLALANGGTFFLCALLTADNPSAALASFGGKLLPFAVIAIALFALFFVQSAGRVAKKR